MEIRNRKDAQEFVTRIWDYTIPDPFKRGVWVLWFNGDRYIDSHLARPTRITVEIRPDRTWFCKNSGRGWTDHTWEEIVNPIQWVYAHRKGINQWLQKSLFIFNR